jgi:hypothetical protein
MLTDTLAILKGEEELQETRDRLNYEQMLHASLVGVMENFVRGARLATHEVTLWSAKKKNDPRREVFNKLTRAEFEESRDEAFSWMKAAAAHYIEKEQQEGVSGKNLSVNSTGEMSTTFTNTGHDETPSNDVLGNPPEQRAAPKPNYCYYCQKWGHTNEFCKDMYPEEDAPNFCDYCGTDGHREETCWILHPDLKLQYLAEQEAKQKRLTCHHCGKRGHIRRWCHLLH